MTDQTGLIVQPRTKPISGCWECHGTSMRWQGKHALGHAQAHAEETGHAVWVAEMERPAPKLPTPPKRKAQKPLPVEPFNKKRLAKKHMCDGKVAHRSAAAAEKALKAAPHDRDFMNAYQCLYCGEYHLGHIIKAARSK